MNNPAFDLVRQLILGLVESPSACKVDVQVARQSTTIIVEPHPDDYGKIIGVDGKTLRCLQAVAYVVGRKFGTKLKVHLADGEGRGKFRPFQVNHDWKPDRLLVLLCKVCEHIFEEPVEIQSWSKANLHHVEVTLSKSEPEASKAVMAQWTSSRGVRHSFGLPEAVSHLFHAVGKVQGGRVTVDVNL